METKKTFKYLVEVEECFDLSDDNTPTYFNVIMVEGNFDVYYDEDGYLDWFEKEIEGEMESLTLDEDLKEIDFDLWGEYIDEDGDEMTRDIEINTTYHEDFFNSEQAARSYFNGLVEKMKE